MPTAVPITTQPLATPTTTEPAAPGIVRPFVILAVSAFLIGFVGCLVLARPTFAPPEQAAAADAPAADALAVSPAPDDWNLPKKI